MKTIDISPDYEPSFKSDLFVNVSYEHDAQLIVVRVDVPKSEANLKIGWKKFKI